ncbi:MAG TPA: c-type cytochrome [Polyangia bacterium]|nr:c-type cytochrome [Polyangia bacterium]
MRRRATSVRPTPSVLVALAVLACPSVSSRARPRPNIGPPAATRAEAAQGATQRITHDGHARPRALAFNDADGLLYVALSTADQVAVVVPDSRPRVLARVDACRFPDAIAALPEGGALVACRFEPGLRRIARDAVGTFRAVPLAGDLPAGGRGLVLSSDGRLAYVASPPLRGIAVVSLPDGRVRQTLPTGISPRAVRRVAGRAWPGHPESLLIVSNFIDHTVTVHPIGVDGRLGAAIQTIRTEAPVLDLGVGGGELPALWLFTHEDRPVSRAHGPVEGLDSGVIRLDARPSDARASDARQPPLDDLGPGRRPFVNLGERAKPVIELAAAALDGGGMLAIVGAGSDNLLLVPAHEARLQDAIVVPVGANPSAVIALPGARFVTADRLSDTLTFVSIDQPVGVESTLELAPPGRPSPAERGELLFYSRALVPHNVADGPLSLYTCAACHDDGHIDGRRHPAKLNRFFSTTSTCRGLGNTAPYLRLGNQATIDVFADNIVATHAQGAERDPAHFDQYSVRLRLREGGGWTSATLSPAQVRTALARYMERIPVEPSPFAAPGARSLSAQARRGLSLFRQGCAGCHQLVDDTALGHHVPEAELETRLLAGQVALTSPGRYAVGTPVLGEGGNNPPSLRGVWDAAPYFSDGSARTLEEVLRRTDPGGSAVHAKENAARPPALSAEDRAALLAFLRVL